MTISLNNIKRRFVRWTIKIQFRYKSLIEKILIVVYGCDILILIYILQSILSASLFYRFGYELDYLSLWDLNPSQLALSMPVTVWIYMRFWGNFQSKSLNFATKIILVYTGLSLVTIFLPVIFGVVRFLPIFYLAFLLIIFLFTVLWKLPKRVLAGWDGKLEPKDYLTIENSLRTTILQLIGGMVVIIGFYFTWQNSNIAEESFKMSLKQNESERFDKAIVMLKDDNPEIRVLAITSLKRMGTVSDDTRSDVIPILVNHVRKWSENRARPEPFEAKMVTVPRDIETAINACSGLLNQWNINRARGRNILMYDAGSDEAKMLFNLENVDFSYLQFQKLILQEGLFRNLHFNESKVLSANLASADLTGAEFQKSDFGEKASFYNAKLIRAKFNGAILIEANFRYANLKDADFAEANIGGASFDEADLEGAKFMGANNLLAQSFLHAKNIEKAFLPDYLRNEILQLKEQLDRKP